MKIGIVGCGGVGRVHANALVGLFKDSEDFSLFLCDNKKAHAEDFKDNFGGTVYLDLDEMLEKENLDSLHICTPHYLHVPMAIKALAKGVNVLMEKPPAITIQELHNLFEAEKNSTARLTICFQNRYNATSELMKTYLQKEEYGKILGARAFVTWKRDSSYYTDSDWRGNWYTEGGGVLTNQSIHTIDLLNYFLGKPISVEGTVANHHLKSIIEVEDTAEAFIDYGDYKACYYATTAYATDSSVFIEIVLENMTLRIDGSYFYCIQHGKIVEQYDMSTEQSIKSTGIIKDYWGNSHQTLIKDYYDKLKTNEEFMVTLDNCQDTIKLVWGIYNSSKVGCEMKI